MSEMRQKEVSVRRIRPTLPDINIPLLMQTLTQWRKEFEEDGWVKVFDDGLLQFELCDERSHHIFYAALVLHKPSLRCSLSEVGPEDVLEEHHHRLRLNGYPTTDDEKVVVDELIDTLRKRGYKLA